MAFNANQFSPTNQAWGGYPAYGSPYGSSSNSPSSSFVWVQGEAGAKAYPVAAGNKVALFDSENPVVYIKSTDINGRPNEIEIYDLIKRNSEEPKEPSMDLSEYIKKKDLETMIAAAAKEQVEKAMSEISLKPTSKTKKKGDDE